MNSQVGSLALVTALLAALATIVVSVVAGRSGSRKLTRLSRHGVFLTTAAVLLGAAVLVHAFLNHDFTIKYVQAYSAERMPTVYLVAAFWGGQAGSLLFWTIVLLVFGSLAAHFSRRRTPELMPWMHAVLMSIAVFFLVLLVFVSNPFEAFQVVNEPPSGRGLNPLLQNYWMAIHPPCLLTGYASMGVPFAFGVGALLSGRVDVDWIRVTRRWLLLSWTFLSVGNVLGGRWAYEELGWGGYWAWDPVENAAILPWFTATALLHSVMVQEHRGMLKRWNSFLLIVSFWLTVFGTFLTRSGILDSVHTFAESGIGPWFLGCVLFISVGGAGLLAWRWRVLAPENRLESYNSRELMFLLNNWLFLAFVFVVLWGTLFPKTYETLTGQESSIGPPWFNQFAIPLALGLLVVMAMGTLFAWRRGGGRRVKRNLKVPTIVALVGSAVLGVLYYFFRLTDLDPTTRVVAVFYSVTALVLVLFNLAIIGQEFWRGVRSRRSKLGGGVVGNLFGLIGKHRRRYGGYLVHVGFVLIVLGIAGNAFKISQRSTLRQGDSVYLGDYLVTFVGVNVEEHPDKIAYFADVEVRNCDRGPDGVLFECGAPQLLRPGRFDYNDYANGENDPGKRTTEVAIVTTLLEDVYIAPINMDVERQEAAFEMFVNPFVFWLWFGTVLLLGAAIVCMWPEPIRVRQERRLKRLDPVLDGLLMLLLVLLPVGLMLAGPAAWAQSEETSGPSTIEREVGLDEESGARLVDPVRTEGTTAEGLYAQIRCACPSCGGATTNHCPPQCAEGRHDRGRIDAWLAEGRSPEWIEQAFVAERGPSALAVPHSPVLVWLVPVLGVLLGIVLVFFAVRALQRSRPAERAAALPSGGSLASTDLGDGYRERLSRELAELD